MTQISHYQSLIGGILLCYLSCQYRLQSCTVNNTPPTASLVNTKLTLKYLCASPSPDCVSNLPTKSLQMYKLTANQFRHMLQCTLEYMYLSPEIHVVRNTCVLSTRTCVLTLPLSSCCYGCFTSTSIINIL